MASRFRVQGLGLSGFRVQDLGFRVWVQGLGFRVQGLGSGQMEGEGTVGGSELTCQTCQVVATIWFPVGAILNMIIFD